MKCQRCDGLMVQDRAYDLLDSGIHCEVWRCVCCGNMFDNRMLVNRERLVSRVQPRKQFTLREDLQAA